MVGKYAIKCDECKKTIGYTDNHGKWFMGGKCKVCKQQANAGNWYGFD